MMLSNKGTETLSPPAWFLHKQVRCDVTVARGIIRNLYQPVCLVCHQVNMAGCGRACFSHARLTNLLTVVLPSQAFLGETTPGR